LSFGKNVGDAMMKIIVGNPNVPVILIEEPHIDVKALSLVFEGLLESWNSEVEVYSCI